MATAAIASALAGGALNAGANALMDDDVPDAPDQLAPERVGVDLAGGTSVTRTQDNGEVQLDINRPNEVEQEIDRRRQALNDLFGSLQTTPDERRQQFENIRESFLERTRAEIDPQFEEQRQRLQAQQEATGRSLSSVGREARLDLDERQAEEITQNARQADLLANRLQRQRTQDILRQIGTTEQNLRNTQQRGQQALQLASNEAAQVAQQQQSVAQDQLRRSQLRNQRERQDIQNVIGGVTSGLQLGATENPISNALFGVGEESDPGPLPRIRGSQQPTGPARIRTPGREEQRTASINDLTPDFNTGLG